MPTTPEFSSEELLDMITRCGLNRLMQFAGFFGRHLRNAKTDPKFLQALVKLDEIQHSGLALGREEEAWAIQHDINIRVNRVSTITLEILLTKRFPLILGLDRISLQAPSPPLCYSLLGERVRMDLC